MVLPNGARWHVPPHKKISDIPAVDKGGDEFQAIASRVAKEWGPDKLTPSEKKIIEAALARGDAQSALLWEKQARGRWMEQTMKEQVKHLNLKWNPQGVDAIDPVTNIRYELLSGTKRNMDDHARRMANELFRMITF